jgi:hypothetical protein
MEISTRVENVLPTGCHAAIVNSATARDLILIKRGKLVFPDREPGEPLHLMGHQSGTSVIEATTEQLKALSNGGAREAAKHEVPVKTFAGAILAGGRIMGGQESASFRKILGEFRDESNRTIEELAPMFGATLSVLDSNEVTAALRDLLAEQREELLKPHSALRLWILAAAPYRAMLHEVYKAALESNCPQEAAWTVARLKGIREAVATSEGATKSSLIEWAQFFGKELEYMLDRELVTNYLVDPLNGSTVDVKEFAKNLKELC